MLNFELRIGLAQGEHYALCHRATFFTLHFALFTSRRDHFSLFTLHFSLPAGTTFHSSLCTFHFPKGPRCDSQCSALRWPMQRAAWAHAPHCGFQASVPRYCTRPHLTESTAFLHTRCTLWQDSGRHAYERDFAPCISLRHTAPSPAPSLLGKAWRQHFCP